MTEPILTHDRTTPACPQWWESMFTMEHDPDNRLLVLLDNEKGGQVEVWYGDDQPTCPYCGANLFVLFDGDCLPPAVWFNRIDSVST